MSAIRKSVASSRRAREQARQDRRDARALIHYPVETTRARRQRSLARRRFLQKSAAWLLLFVCMVIIGGFVFHKSFYENPDFTLKVLDVETDGGLSEQQILLEADIPVSANLLKLDIGKIDDRLSSLSQVKKASVKRVLPDRLTIRIEEHRPVAWLASDQVGGASKREGGILISNEGVALQCMTLHPRYHSLPIIRLSHDRIRQQIVPGRRVDLPSVSGALNLLHFWGAHITHHEIFIEEIDARLSYRLDVYCQPTMRLQFAMENLPGQLRKLNDVLDHGQSRGRHLARVNLTVRQNVPVVYHDSQYEPLPAVREAANSMPIRATNEVGKSARDDLRSIISSE